MRSITFQSVYEGYRSLINFGTPSWGFRPKRGVLNSISEPEPNILLLEIKPLKIFQ